MKKIITIVGARPQFVKAAIVSHAISKISSLNEILIHTGQHYDINMSQVFFDELEIHKIDHQLDIGSGPHGQQTGKMLASIENILLLEKPDYVLIYGDTNSTLAGALAAAKLHIPIAHIEAGLRSYNRKMSEEINRIIADQLSDILFTPTKQSMTNLIQEGYPSSRIIEVGDVMYDAALYYGDKASKKSTILEKLNIENKQYVLATIHRAENTDNNERLKTIFQALEYICKDIPVIMPLHPRTKKMLEINSNILLENSKIKIISPLGFLDMILLEKNATLMMTDSGGVQKEAFFYSIPCITLRDETEWIETVELGWNHVVKPDNIDKIYLQALKSIGKHGIKQQYPYGQGNASLLISKYLAKGI